MPMKVTPVLAFATAASAAVATLACLALVPVRQHFALYDTEVYDGEPPSACTGIQTSQGTGVSFSWSAPSNITFGAWSCSLNENLYLADGASGLGYFVSPGGPIQFGAVCASEPCVKASVNGTYGGPLLTL
jgi:hypothetical protein